jgi:hypothetical protein
MTTVKKILETAPLNRLKVRTGKNNLEREITDAVVMEVPDLKPWLKGGELVLTSFYAARGSVDTMCRLVEEIADLCSCLAVKTGIYLSAIPEEVLAAAERHHLPILEIPADLSYSTITTIVMTTLANEKNAQVMINHLFGEIVEKQDLDPLDIYDRGALLGLDFRLDCFLVLVTDHPDYRLLLNLKDLGERKFHLRSCQVQYGDQNLLVFMSREEKPLRQFTQELSGKMPRLEGRSCGIGICAREAQGLRNSYFRAQEALHIGRVMYPGETYYDAARLGILAALEKAMNCMDLTWPSQVISALAQENLLETLENYYICHGSTRAMSEALCVHPNTILYRLHKIEEISGCQLENPLDNLRLFTACFAYRLHRLSID